LCALFLLYASGTASLLLRPVSIPIPLAAIVHVRHFVVLPCSACLLGLA
jgi:hypothetical protein